MVAGCHRTRSPLIRPSGTFSPLGEKGILPQRVDSPSGTSLKKGEPLYAHGMSQESSAPQDWGAKDSLVLWKSSRVIHGADAPWLDSCDEHRNEGGWGGAVISLIVCVGCAARETHPQ